MSPPRRHTRARLAVGLYFLSRKSLNSTVASALIVTAINLVLLLIIPMFALPYIQPAYLAYMRVPFISGQPFNPALLTLIFGVMLCNFFSHMLIANYGKVIKAENLGLVPVGGGGPAAERGEFTLGGRTPINPSGGLESNGHPLGATGIGQLYELVTQLRGEAGARQVEGARHAIQENGGGLQGIEEAAVAVHILSR